MQLRHVTRLIEFLTESMEHVNYLLDHEIIQEYFCSGKLPDDLAELVKFNHFAYSCADEYENSNREFTISSNRHFYENEMYSPLIESITMNRFRELTICFANGEELEIEDLNKTFGTEESAFQFSTVHDIGPFTPQDKEELWEAYKKAIKVL